MSRRGGGATQDTNSADIQICSRPFTYDMITLQAALQYGKTTTSGRRHRKYANMLLRAARPKPSLRLVSALLVNICTLRLEHLLAAHLKT